MTTVGEYTLHVLFTSFIAQSEEKLNECVAEPFDPEPSVEDICGPGVDPAFDQLIVAMGHIAKQKPKALVDSMMLWRKHKSDAAATERTHLKNLVPVPLKRSNTEPVTHNPNLPSQVQAQPPDELAENGQPQPTLAERQVIVAQAERRSTVSIYILCRVLIEVISQSTLSSITPEMEDKLEGIIFGQLKIADTDQLLESKFKLANWNLFTQLLGVMSEINFVGVTNRFIDDLDHSLQALAAKNPATNLREVEGKIELVLGGMKHLRIKTAPADAWDQSCDFMLSLGKLFAKSHGPRVKSAFCQMLEMLLIPIAANASNAHLASARWIEVVAAIAPRSSQMFLKPRHWTVAFPLTAALHCAGPMDSFTNQWLQLVTSLQARLKDRMTRPLCLQVISRLVWTYVYRIKESSTQARVRRLDEVVKLILPSARRSLSAPDDTIVEPMIQIIRIIVFKYPEYGFKNIIFPLVNADQIAAINNKELKEIEESKTPSFKPDQLDPDRVVIGIRAFLVVMADFEKSQQPPFPQNYPAVPATERVHPVSPVLMSPSSGTPTSPPSFVSILDATLSRPVALSALNESVREYYKRFCHILGKIAMICNCISKGQVSQGNWEEKFNSPGPKTPITDTFNFRREELSNVLDQKQTFHELLHVAIQALPRCLHVDIPFASLVNLLCTGTAHPQTAIAESAAQSLKAIARQLHAQQVTTGFSRFIFNLDPSSESGTTMADSGMLGASHIENTLRLYVELLHIWIAEIRQSSAEITISPGDESNVEQHGKKLDISELWAEVDQIEAHALFFLCSQSRKVRLFAITVLRLVTQFEFALGNSRESSPRLIDLLEKDSQEIMKFKEELLSVAERSRLQRGMQTSNNNGALIELCTSDVTYDTTLWFKILPNFARIAFERCPLTVTMCRDLICERIRQMYPAIVTLSEPPRGYFYGSDSGSARITGRTPFTQPDVLVEQWKLYVTFACTTLQEPGMVHSSLQSNHSRKGSKPGTSRKIDSGRVLFKFLIPLLQASSSLVRDSVVVAMGCINKMLYRPLLEELKAQVSQVNADSRQFLHHHQRTNSSPRRNSKMDLLRTEITHVYKLTSHFLKEPEVYQEEWILRNLCDYTRDLKLFLMDGDVQMDWEFQKLRRHYCGLMEELFQGINRTPDPSQWMTFESRKSAFSLMEDWCGFSPNQNQIRQREDSMRQSVIDQQGLGDRGTLTAAMEIEKRNLRTAALSSMAALCAGPLNVTNNTGVTLSFDPRRMLAWIEAIFNSGSDRMNVIGKRALKNLIVHNKEYPSLLDHSIHRCYLGDAAKVVGSHFTVVTEVLRQHPDYPLPFWKLVSLCLFTLGSDQSEIRSRSAQLMRVLEERQQPGRTSKIQDFDISIADKTKAVYKLAQFEISKRLAKQHPEIAFHIFSEFTTHFKSLHALSQRNIVAVMLPWIQTIELKLDPNGGPTGQSYVLLANLLEITIKSSAALHNEVQALWQALATGPHPGNVRLVLDFIISLCLERREQNFVEYAKQVVVFLSSTNSKVVEFLLSHVTPKAMVPNEKRDIMPPPPDTTTLPYCADLTEALPVGTKQAGFSLGQLSLILLVDLMISPIQLTAENVPILLQVVTVLWDHYTPLVQEQAREMLVHLIHELVLARLGDDSLSNAHKSAIQDLIDLVRSHDRTVVWSYEDNNGKSDDDGHGVPLGMEKLTAEMIWAFSLSFPGIKEQWGRLCLTWATSCPVRHLACRSFQIFRCILTSLDQLMLGDMLARLSNTIADEDSEIQTFAMEILTTLHTLISKLDSERLVAFPQLFWTTIACLETINEREFLESIGILNVFLNKLDFNSPAIRKSLLDGWPSRWEGKFEGIQLLLNKGFRSANCLETVLKTLDKVIQLPSDPLTGDDDRLFTAILANLPRLLYAMEQNGNSQDNQVIASAKVLQDVAVRQGLEEIALVLDNYISLKYRSSHEFLSNMISALRNAYLPRLDFQMVSFLMGLLTNRFPWMKATTMKILKIVLPEIDMKKPELAGHGSDLISPLLRLLQSDFCMEALEVLDNILTMSGSSNDRHHLRMSMTRSTSRTARREYERIDNLFGIPDTSGWAIPVPTKKTETTRANIHAAFYMCQSGADGSVAGVEANLTSEVEFHAEEFPYGYYPPPEEEARTDTMMSDEVRPEVAAQSSDLSAKLDALDDFFDDDMSTTSFHSDGRSSRTITEFAPDGFEVGAQLYDEQTLPILHQASSNSTIGSFQNGFADRPVPANMMNPGAFNFPALPSNASHGPGQAVTAATRPNLHSRSVTSPSASTGQMQPFPSFTQVPYHQTTLSASSTMTDTFSDDDMLTEEVFSDDDRPSTSNGPGPTYMALGSTPYLSKNPTSHVSGGSNSGHDGSGSFFLENMIRPLAQTTRSGMRRLTGGRPRDGDRQRELFRSGMLVGGPSGSGQSSPQVPKVPVNHLGQQPFSPSPQQQQQGTVDRGSTEMM